LYGRAEQFDQGCDNGILPLICPTCQKVLGGFGFEADNPGLLCMGLFSIFFSGHCGVGFAAW